MNERDSNFYCQKNDKQNEGQPQNVTVPRFVFMLDYQKFLLAIELFLGDVPFSQFFFPGYPKRTRPLKKLCLIYRSKAWLPNK